MDKQDVIAFLKSNSTVTTKSCLTYVKVNEFHYTWTIKNYDFWQEDPDGIRFLESPQFITNYGEELIWKLQLLPDDDVLENDKECLHLELWLVTQENSLTPFQIELSLLNANDVEVAINRIDFNELMLDSPNNVLRFVKRDVVLDKTNRLLNDGMLIIVCKIFFVGEVTQFVSPLISHGIDNVESPCHPEQFDNYDHQLFKQKTRNLMQSKNSIVTKSGLTYVKINEFHYTWMIKNLEFWHPRDSDSAVLESPEYIIHPKGEIRRTLVLYDEDLRNARGYFSLEVDVSDDNELLIRSIHAEVTLLNANDEELAVKQVAFEERMAIKHEQVYIREFIKKDFLFDQKNNILKNGVLTILCKMLFTYGEPRFYPDPIIRGHYRSDTIKPHRRLEQFDRYQRMLFSEKFSDFKFIVGGEELPVHSNILVAKSRVFAAMLEHDTKDKREGQAEIEDIELDVLREMLRFIYIGKVNGIEKLAPELLAAADKYDLQDLKLACEVEIINCLSLDNIKAVREIADRYNADKLKEAVMEFTAKDINFLN